MVHGPSCTSAAYQETQSEVEKAHEMVRYVWPYAVEAVRRLTGVALGFCEVRVAGTAMEEAVPERKDGLETLLILQGSLFPNAVEAVQELEEEGWRGLGCMSVRLMNPFPEEDIRLWTEDLRAVAVLDRSNSFGSIPPLASRVFNTFARTVNGAGHLSGTILRSLVGGLGGREITVPEMKELLLSTHLLFSPAQPWEREALERWVSEDGALTDWIEELTALHMRAVARHTRVPGHVRGKGLREEEALFRARIRRQIVSRDYVGLLAHYNQVEFVAPRELYGETVLRQQLVIELEKRLARLAAENARIDVRRALVLLHYGGGIEDREKARKLLSGSAEGAVSPLLLGRYGLDADSRLGFSAGVRLGSPGGSDSATSASTEEVSKERTAVAWTCLLEEEEKRAAFTVPFDPEEAGRIEKVLEDLVDRSARRPLYFNPEDYDRRLLEILAQDGDSQWHRLFQNVSPDAEASLGEAYLYTYRDVIDGCVPRKVLAALYGVDIERFEVLEHDRGST